MRERRGVQRLGRVDALLHVTIQVKPVGGA
jgi:hypothetical protein